jgi:hypothetical protein
MRHGTLSSYNNGGCRCELCTAARRAYAQLPKVRAQQKIYARDYWQRPAVKIVKRARDKTPHALALQRERNRAYRRRQVALRTTP